MKKFCAVLFFLFCLTQLAHATETILNHVVATVNHHAITSYDVKKLQHDFAVTGRELSTEEALMLSIRHAIENTIAEQQHISINSQELEAAIETLSQERGFTNTQQFIKQLQAQNMSLDDFMSHLKQDLMSQRLRLSIVNTVFQPSDEMIRTYIRQTQQQHNALFFVEEAAFLIHDQQEAILAHRKADQFYAALKKGDTPFDKIVQNLSTLMPEGLTHKGWVPAAPLLATLQKASAQDIPIPSAYPPIQIGNVIHVLHITAQKDEPTPFAPVDQRDVEVLRIMDNPLRTHDVSKKKIDMAYQQLSKHHQSLRSLCHMYAEDNQSLFPDCHYGWVSPFTPLFNDDKITAEILSRPITTAWFAPIPIPHGWLLIHVIGQKTAPLSHSNQRLFAIKMLEKQNMDSIYGAFLKGAYEKTYIFIAPHAIHTIEQTHL